MDGAMDVWTDGEYLFHICYVLGLMLGTLLTLSHVTVITLCKEEVIIIPL